MAWPMIAAAGATALGSILSGAQQQRAQRSEAQRNRQFQERMRNTAWQAAVADMKAAGINPAVAYSKGPAAAPSGAMASQEGILGHGASSAMQAIRIKKELQLLDAQTRAAANQASKTGQEALYQERMNRLWGNWDTQGRFSPGPLWQRYVADANFATSSAQLRQLEIPMLKNISSLAQTPPGKWAAWIQYLLRGTQLRK
jgi:hypothetical protein